MTSLQFLHFKGEISSNLLPCWAHCALQQWCVTVRQQLRFASRIPCLLPLLSLCEGKQANKQKCKFKPFSSMSPLCVTATVCDCAIATEVRAPHTAFTAVRFRPLLGLREGGGGLLLRSNVVTSAGVSTNLSSRNTWDYFEFSSTFI